ncbi:hypothetical protein EJ065_6383 [Corallococcus coralloides]|uniref:Lipoprotein n=2 Tax=Corallococcus coralloides TaxID=184914 RepID=A0A410S1A2_CORCK|nr:hypothetical protein EJ065_6383 [Corallococcus coralloides]
MRGIFSALVFGLLVGCGGAMEPASTDDTASQPASGVTASVLLECEELDGMSCPSSGANPRQCIRPGGVGHAFCYCDGEGYDYWRCYY